MTPDYTALLASARAWAIVGGAADDAEDVAQDAVIRLWRRAEAGAAWGSAGELYAYLHRTVRSVLVDRARHGQAACRAGVVASLDWRTQGGQGEPLGALLRGGDAEADALTRAELTEALARLRAMGPRGRACLLDAAGYDAREVAGAMGAKRRTVYAWAAWARAELRREEKG